MASVPLARQIARAGRVLGLMACGVGASAHVHAQVVDAGSLSRSLQDNVPAVPATRTPRLVPGAQAAAVSEGFSLRVDEFVVEGSSLPDASRLQEVLAPFRGRQLDAVQLQQACEAIASVYRSRGKLARVFVPAQTVSDGRLRIAVVESRLAGIRSEGQPARVDGAFVERVVRDPVGNSMPVDIGAIERGILIANDLPGVVVDGVLQAGDAPGDTVLRLRVQDGPAWQGAITANSWGGRTTGQEQLLVSVSRNFARGEQLSAGLVASTGLQALRVAGEAPLGASGLRIQGSASYLQYHLGREYRPLDARGEASTTSIGVGYPVIRSQQRNLRLAAAIEHSSYTDKMLGSVLRQRDVDVLNAQASGDWTDGLLGSSVTQWVVQTRLGFLSLGAGDDRLADSVSARTAGDLGVLGLNITRTTGWASGWVGSVGVRAQSASKNLDSSEQFSLGGPTAMRAYPLNEAAGDSGWLASVSLRRKLVSGWSAGVFADAGRVRLHKSPWLAGLNAVSLQDVGISVEWRSNRLSMDLSLAAPLAHNPASGDPARHQDGSRREPRVLWRLQYAL